MNVYSLRKKFSDWLNERKNLLITLQVVDDMQGVEEYPSDSNKQPLEGNGRSDGGENPSSEDKQSLDADRRSYDGDEHSSGDKEHSGSSDGRSLDGYTDKQTPTSEGHSHGSDRQSPGTDRHPHGVAEKSSSYEKQSLEFYKVCWRALLMQTTLRHLNNKKLCHKKVPLKTRQGRQS